MIKLARIKFNMHITSLLQDTVTLHLHIYYIQDINLYILCRACKRPINILINEEPSLYTLALRNLRTLYMHMPYLLVILQYPQT